MREPGAIFGAAALGLGQMSHQHPVRLLTTQLDQLVLQGLEHRSGADERVVRLGAPPMELLAALAPVATLPLAHGRRDMAVLVGLVDPSQWQLPAHLWLPVQWPLVASQRRLMERATGAGVEARPVQEDAGPVDETRHDVAVLVDLDRTASLVRLLLELPLVDRELLCHLLHVATVLAAREVRAVRAAALHHLGRGLG